ncbi:MAG TPA: hypothetical protein VK804_23245 [Bradyrhizobium sp.]|jgi:hypothetical protein|uniref:DUF6932 family protein n=1 Tax=Bradyrhizobium sp. TaxID=376 RepID=UPI002CC0DB9A|nr:hypothetical protein [Bradyrhizobium sp.]HTB03395.1 hypothetical protein [Bradyrhizobium sp.]
MPVPAFDARGLLPPFLGANSAIAPSRSPYPSLMTELVSMLGGTPERCNLLFSLLKYRSLLHSFGYVDGVQFIDGSFVENVETREGRDPRDIDIFSFLIRPVQYHGNDPLWQSTGFAQWTGEIVNQSLNKQRYQLDTYAIAVDQAGPLQLMNETIYWYSLFSHKRVTQEWKGFVAVPLNASDDQTALSAIISGS